MRQLAPGDMGDRQEQEELILEGSLQEPQDLEAEDDHFMKYSILHRDGLGTKVQCGSQPCLAGSLPGPAPRALRLWDCVTLGPFFCPALLSCFPP